MNKANFIVLNAVMVLFAMISNIYAEGMDKMSMNPDQEAIQKRMQEYSMPNANHEILKSLEGSWITDVKFWMDPAGEPQVSKGSAESKIIMGGRFLEQHYEGMMMGQPFEGRALLGYDNMKKAYQGLWFDNFATGIMESTAQYNPATKILTEEGAMSCPITQETHRWYKAVTTIVDEDHYTYESFMKDKDGKEFKSMVISYTRVK